MMFDPKPTPKYDYLISAGLFIAAIFFIVMGLWKG